MYIWNFNISRKSYLNYLQIRRVYNHIPFEFPAIFLPFLSIAPIIPFFFFPLIWTLIICGDKMRYHDAIFDKFLSIMLYHRSYIELHTRTYKKNIYAYSNLYKYR